MTLSHMSRVSVLTREQSCGAVATARPTTAASSFQFLHSLGSVSLTTITPMVRRCQVRLPVTLEGPRLVEASNSFKVLVVQPLRATDPKNTPIICNVQLLCFFLVSHYMHLWRRVIYVHFLVSRYMQFWYRDTCTITGFPLLRWWANKT